MNQHILIYGASRGLGKAFLHHFGKDSSNTVWGVSRSIPKDLPNERIRWITADLSDPIIALSQLKEHFQESVIDTLIMNVGIWEANAFEDHYNFLEDQPSDILKIINTNISSTILQLQWAIPKLKASKNARVFMIGSTSALSNSSRPEVSFNATKSSLNGIVEALRVHLRPYGIPLSLIHPGYLDTSEYYLYNHQPAPESGMMPAYDVVLLVDGLLKLSAAACPKLIHLPATSDENV